MNGAGLDKYIFLIFNLSDPNIGYLIISSQNESTSVSDIKFLSDKLANILYAKDYTLIPVTGYYNQQYENDSFCHIQLISAIIAQIDEFNYFCSECYSIL
jgi:hypothetical protein